ncbi:DUF3343 domain-containing protein [Clostridium formicaceticum]|uniref:Putative Se/S carrier protein-like domain-containing protein n=1 Tax=Clostridium formicaceticum TaxID=1497 RepID=A0AAC9RM21_9CLOT|nr:DUF3343 domain-containing protein [Clostridium formicaceticum]AOY76973.1 hypothetical protein BJL90_14580 [Clostridium formicaceticum]ARE87458.1 hypothetical protein CLFO_18580 [Clostridium formicaceticum]
MQQKSIIDKYYIAVFDSRNHAMQLHQHLKKMNLNQFQLISTPCKIKAGCSYSIKFLNLEDAKVLMEEADKMKKKISSIYSAERINKARVLKKLKSI